MKKSIIYTLLISILINPFSVLAADVGSITIAGATLNINETKTLDVTVSSGIRSADGDISAADPSCIEVVSVTSTNGSGNYFNDLTMSANDLSTVARVTIKGLKGCTTTLKVTNASLSTRTNEQSGLTFTSGTIRVNGDASTKSSDAALSALTVSKGTLTPAFDPDTREYSVEVENDVDSININATKSDSKATLTGDGNKSLSVGSNRIEVKVVAEDGTTSRSYIVNVTRKGGSGEGTPTGGEGEGGGTTPDPTPVDTRSSDNTLKKLSVSKGSLDPTFDKDKTTYTLNVDNDVTSIDVEALPNDEKASVSILGNTNLKEGMNTITVKVTAENESVKTYTINVNRKKSGNKPAEETVNKSSNNLLKSLLVGDGTLKPSFDPNTTEYAITVGNDVNNLDLKAYAQDSKAKVSISGNENLKVGKNTITITVTAENGAQRIYTVNVTKIDKEGDNKLDDITISEGELSPKFNPNNTFYDVEVKSGTDTIDVTPKLQNPNSKVHYFVNGVEQQNGKVKLNEGNNLVQLQVEDETGLVKSYYLNVNRKLSYFSVFGLKIPKWLIYTLLVLFLLLFAYLLFLLFKKRKQKKVIVEPQTIQSAPKIEFKPEFNFGSKNQDNDQVQDGGVLNQSSSDVKSQTEDHDEEGITKKSEEIPYDPYDDVVTKDEIMDAIIEKDPEKLKMLYEQEMLNRKKEELRRKEEEKGE